MLDKLFIKDRYDKKNPKVRNAYGMLASIVGIIMNILLSIAKMIVGVIFHSVAIMADAVNNFSDAGSASITLLGFKISNKPADKKHPFGHARFEYIASMIVSFIILFLGIELAAKSIEKMVHGGTTDTNYIMMIVLGVSIVVKVLMFFYYRSIGKKIDSEALRTMSIDSINDAIATFAVLLSMVIMYFTKVNLDASIGFVVAAYIVISGISLFKKTISPLIGENPSDEFVANISKKVHSYDGVLGVHDLMVHNYGPNKYHASLHVEVDANKDIMALHDLIDTIERDFKADGIDMVIHMDPIVRDDERVDYYKELVKEKLRDIDERITFHDFRAVFGENRKKLIFDIAVPSDIKLDDDEIIDMLREKINLVDANCYMVIDVDRNYVGIQ